MSGVLYGGVPEEFVVLGWVVSALLVGISVSSSFVVMTRRGDVLPERIYEINRRHGWPGRSAMESQGTRRLATIIFGVALLVLVLLVPIWSFVDSSITTDVIDRLLLALQLVVLVIWAGYLALRWSDLDSSRVRQNQKPPR
jgi:hypothetical protein